MTFIPVAMYTLSDDPQFVGYAIKGTIKLQSTNVYTESEMDQLREQLDRLNQDVNLKQFWPHPQDPEVKALTDDPTFHPIELVEVDVVDDERSHYVYQMKPARDPKTDRLVMVDSDEIDEDASVIVTRKAQVPAKPTDAMLRIKAACEQVARQRAGLSASV